MSIVSLNFNPAAHPAARQERVSTQQLPLGGSNVLTETTEDVVVPGEGHYRERRLSTEVNGHSLQNLVGVDQLRNTTAGVQPHPDHRYAPNRLTITHADGHVRQLDQAVIVPDADASLHIRTAYTDEVRSPDGRSMSLRDTTTGQDYLVIGGSTDIYRREENGHLQPAGVIEQYAGYTDPSGRHSSPAHARAVFQTSWGSHSIPLAMDDSFLIAH